MDARNLTPGQRWQPELERALRQSSSLAFFIGPSGPGAWQEEELQLALDRAVRAPDEFRVIPILLPAARPEDARGFVGLRTWVDFREGLDDVAAFRRLVASIKGQAPEGDSQQLPDHLAPYRGLLPFGREHARFFFGRETEIQAVLDKLRQSPFVALVGASGVGKSSLILAGVLPRLEGPLAGLFPHLRIKTMFPGGRPLRALADQLASLVPPESRLVTAEALTQRLASHPDALRSAVGTLTVEQPGTLLLVVDQLEELFTHAARESSAQEISSFLANLKDAVEHSRGSIRVITTLRADFFERCLGEPMLRELLQDHQVLLGSMSPAALQEAILRPAQEVGAFLEKGLVGTILRDVSAEPGTLPLLEHALYELWRARRGAWLTLSAYEASGGVSGALQRRAQSCYESLSAEEKELARKLFLRLTTLGEGTPDTRRHVARGELIFPRTAPAQVEHVLQVLSGPEARLLVIDSGTVKVAHEVLIRQWPTLRRWLEDDRRKLRIHRRLTEATNEWTERGRDPSYLYTGSRLLEAEESFASNPEPLNQWERDFLHESLALRDETWRAEERQRQQELEQARHLATEAEARRRAEAERASEARRSAQHLRIFVGVLVLAVFGILTFWEQAQVERDHARSRELTAKAVLNLKEDPQQSLRSIQEAWRIAPTEDIAPALFKWREEPGVAVLHVPSSRVEKAAFGPDGSRIVTVSDDHAARLWEAASGKLLATLQGHSGPVHSAEFSPDGSRLATASEDGTARLWETASGKLLSTLQSQSGQILYVVFSPDGSRIAASSLYFSTYLWEVSSGKVLASLGGHWGSVGAPVFGLDGSFLVTGSADGTVRVWDATSGRHLSLLQSHQGSVTSVALSPDGSRLVTVTNNGTVRIWSCWIWAPVQTKLSLSSHLEAGLLPSCELSPGASARP
jgi:hypothetical protein